MISLASDLTDSKGRHARGWLFYDAECDFCTRLARWVAGPLRRRGLDCAPLQDPRVGALLDLPRQELLRSLRFLAADGLHAGADAVVALAREFWFARPLVWLAAAPGAMLLMHSVYHGIARRRRCSAETCQPRPAFSRG